MEVVYGILADLVVIAHFAYVLFVVFGLLAVLIGRILKWNWTRRFWFRVIHLAMIAIVVAEAWLGIICPLTTWENSLRKLAGKATYEGDFIGRWAHELVFLDIPQSNLTPFYTVFGLLVLLSFVLSPPQWPQRRVRSDANTPAV
jgi:hypothetical protein